MYNHRKAASLDNKARALLAAHRRRVFDDNGDLHGRAIRRIQKLMGQYWCERSSVLAGERLARMGY